MLLYAFIVRFIVNMRQFIFDEFSDKMIFPAGYNVAILVVRSFLR